MTLRLIQAMWQDPVSACSHFSWLPLDWGGDDCQNNSVGFWRGCSPLARFRAMRLAPYQWLHPTWVNILVEQAESEAPAQTCLLLLSILSSPVYFFWLIEIRLRKTKKLTFCMLLANLAACFRVLYIIYPIHSNTKMSGIGRSIKKCESIADTPNPPLPHLSNLCGG